MFYLSERRQVEIQFCGCTLDQVRLIRMGYIGGSPVHPQTAYSIRLLRLHHSLWKYCTVRTQGFTLGLDEFLDPANPLMLVAKTQQASQPYNAPLLLQYNLFAGVLMSAHCSHENGETRLLQLLMHIEKSCARLRS